MDQYMITGGRPLTGEVTISGYKNAALGIITAAIMTDETVRIENVPSIGDMNVLVDIIREIGGKVTWLDKNTLLINGGSISTTNVDFDFARKIRASYYFLGALLGRFGKAKVVTPGGCDLGARPFDQHIKGFEALGADVKVEHGFITASADKLHSSHIYFDVSSVGATINTMLAACLTEGITTLECVAKEPHVVDIANFLNCMGANIKGAGTDVIRIKGVKKLHGCEYSIIPDQIEAGTFMFMAAATRGNVLIRNVIPKHLEAFTSKLLEIGATVEEFDDSVRVSSDKALGNTNVKTLVYPGFLTDMLPQMATLLTISKGTSIVTETITDSRYRFVDELRRMGALIQVVEKTTAVIEGVDRLTGARVYSPDLRGGIALVMAGLMAEGLTVVENIELIERGYEDFEIKMRALGASFIKVDSEDSKTIEEFYNQFVS